MTGNPYFFRLVWQWWVLPHPDSAFPGGRCSLVSGAHLAHPTPQSRGGGVYEGRRRVGGGGGFLLLLNGIRPK